MGWAVYTYKSCKSYWVNFLGTRSGKALTPGRTPKILPELGAKYQSTHLVTVPFTDPQIAASVRLY